MDVIIMCFVVPVAVVIATLVVSLAMVEKFLKAYIENQKNV